MADRDQNFVDVGWACLNTDTVQGTNLVRIAVEESTGALKVNTSATISFAMVPITPRNNGNYTACKTFVGQDGNVYPWVATAAGEVLVDDI